MAYEPIDRLTEMLDSFDAASRLFRKAYAHLPEAKVDALIEAHRSNAPLVQRLHQTERSLEYARKQLEKLRNADGMS